MAGVNVQTNRYATCNIIVAPTIAEGAMFTSIGSALTYAVANSLTDIFIKPGTYTENFTLPAGINLIAYNTDCLIPTVTIVGKITMTAAGTSTISGIRLQTNSDFFLVVSGSVASVIHLRSCYLDCTNSTGISYTSSSASSGVNINYCNGNIGTTGIALFASSGAGNFGFNWSGINNTGGSTTNSTHSAGTLGINFSSINHAITTSGTSTLFLYYSLISGADQNITALTVGGSGSNTTIASHIQGGTSAALTVNTTLNASNLQINSSNAAQINGTGTITYSAITFKGTTTPIASTVTQTLRPFGPKLQLSTSASSEPTSLSAQTSNSGGSNLIQVGNASTSASSDAYLQAFTNGGTSGDPYTLYSIVSAQAWTTGIDNSDSDAYVISASSTLGTSNVMRAATTGNVDFPTSWSIASGTACTVFTQGTFSPTIQGSSTAGTVNMTTQVGRYQKIGRIAVLTIDAAWSTIGTATGAAQINNLPFTNANVSTINQSFCTATTNALTTATNAAAFLAGTPNAVTANVNYIVGAGGAGGTNTVGVITATNGFRTTYTYETT